MIAATALIALATYARIALSPYVGEQIGVFVFFTAVVAIVAWRRGLLLGLIATGASCVAIVFFLSTSFQGVLSNAWDVFIILLFAVISIVLSWLADIRLRHIQLLDRLEEQRNMFISSANHELRSPLMAVKLFTDLLRRKGASDKQEFDRTLLKIDEEVAHMEHLISDLLDITQIRRGTLVYRDSMFSLEESVREVAQILQKTSECDISIRGHIGAGVLADKEKIKQVCTNIISNAIKYSPQGGKIEISLRESARAAVIGVRDHGHGIAPQNIQKIFDPFFREKSQATASVAGLGLGLYISKLIVEHYGGRLSVASKEGEGTLVTIVLPTARAASAPRAVAPRLEALPNK